MTDVKVTQADWDAWEKYGPMIFNCKMIGPEVLARHAAQAREEERALTEKHRNDLMDKILSLRTDIGVLKAQLAVAREEGAKLMQEAQERDEIDWFRIVRRIGFEFGPSYLSMARGIISAIRALSPAEVVKGEG